MQSTYTQETIKENIYEGYFQYLHHDLFYNMLLDCSMLCTQFVLERTEQMDSL